MTKINMSGSNVGAKGICAVIDANGTVLPCLATDNGDGTATLKIDGEFTAAIDPGLLATEANQVTAQTSLDSIVLSGTELESLLTIISDQLEELI